MSIATRRFPLLQKADDGKGAGAGAAGAGAGEGAGAGAGAAGASASPWFSETHKDYVTNKHFKSPDDALVSLQNAEKLIGAERAGRTLIRPKDDKDVEGIKAWRAGIGVPEKPDDYGLPVPDGQDPGFAKEAAAWFHEIGIAKADAVKLTEKWNGHLAKTLADIDEQLKAGGEKQLGELRGEWGNDFDKKSEEARRFMKASGWDDAKIARYEQAFGTADMLKTFSSLGSKMGEAGFVKGDGQGAGGMTKQAAQQRIAQLQEERVAGKITQKDYLTEMDKLGPIAHAA